MRLIAFVFALVALSTAVLAGDEKRPGKPKKKPPPPPGIHWEVGLEAGMARATREGRPVFIAVNALETERANQLLAAESYRSAAWGQATRGYVSFVCNPNDHGEGDQGPCSRYLTGDCATHKATLTWFLDRFGQDLISPQHVILEPDGDVAYRKEYFTYVVGPGLLDTYLSNLAPNIAYARAGIGREKKMSALRKAAPEEIEGLASSWLHSGDGLAAAALTNVLEDTYDATRRLLLIAALRPTPILQAPVLAVAAEERVLFPMEEVAETLAWLRTLFAVDRPTGVWGATRALARLGGEGYRDDILRIWADVEPEAPEPGIGDVPESERAAAFEALILAKDHRGLKSDPPMTWTMNRVQQIRRAWKKTGHTTIGASGLVSAIKDANPGRLRRALLDASIDEVRENADPVKRLLGEAPWQRVKVAAALRLFELRMPHAGMVAATILSAVDDPIEGPDAHAYIVRVLGEDPGQSPAVWWKIVQDRLKGEDK